MQQELDVCGFDVFNTVVTLIAKMFTKYQSQTRDLAIASCTDE